MQALTFQELAELLFLLQSGLEIEELPVTAVHSVVSHLLKAACALTLQGCLVLRRKATVNNPYRPPNSPAVLWSLSAPQSPEPTEVPPNNSSDQPFLRNRGCTAHRSLTMKGMVKTG